MTKSKDSENNQRESPGEGGEGEFYHIEVLPKQEFKTFRTHDVGGKGGIERVAGQRADGTWETVKWLVAKDMARIEKGKLIAVEKEAKELFEQLNAIPKHIKGDIFEAKAGRQKSTKKS